MDSTGETKNGDDWEVIDIDEVERPQSDGVFDLVREDEQKAGEVPPPSGGTFGEAAKEGVRDAVKYIVMSVIIAAVVGLLALAIAWFFGKSPLDVWDCLWQDNRLACLRDVVDDSASQVDN